MRAAFAVAACALSACGSGYLAEGETKSLVCWDLERDAEAGVLRLTGGQGGDVQVQDGAAEYTVTYRRTRNWIIEEYEGDGVRLTRDPEVFLYRRNGERLGPCQ